MNKPFLDIVDEKLELSDLGNENNSKIYFDINSDYDGSVASFAAFAQTGETVTEPSNSGISPTWAAVWNSSRTLV